MTGENSRRILQTNDMDGGYKGHDAAAYRAGSAIFVRLAEMRERILAAEPSEVEELLAEQTARAIIRDGTMAALFRDHEEAFKDALGVYDYMVTVELPEPEKAL